MSVKRTSTAEEPGSPRDLEGQTPADSTDHIRGPSQDEKANNPNLVRLHPTSVFLPQPLSPVEY